ncbi:hypothetical protein WCD74_14995 [Actinomycetospora sp. OC33-EN08]|uniref:Uncharacterized protein n=1 Tax=Actinomycetospora aurantiaca TaxID=3129233 RepID=A0ABU8MP30_9PSEU
MKLPRELLASLAELRVALEVAPWSVGAPLVPTNPAGLRRVAFGDRGRAQVVYGVIDRDRLVSLLQLIWL